MPTPGEILASIVRALIALFGTGPVAGALQAEVDAIRLETEKEIEDKFPTSHD